MTGPKVVYLAGPYRPYVDEAGVRHTISENVRQAGKYGIEVWRRGYVALVPHTLTYLDPKRQRQDGGIGDIPPEAFMEGELELIRRSDMLVLIPNWEYSKGAIAEMQFAYKNKIPSYRWEDWLEWDDYQKGFAGRRNGTGESVGDAGTEAVPGDTDPLGTLQAVQRVAVGSGRWG